MHSAIGRLTRVQLAAYIKYNDLGHTRATVERYIGLLERLFLIRRLPAWHRNSAKRLVKAPKLHFCDSGLVTALTRLTTEEWMRQQAKFGHLLESFALQQLIAQSGWLNQPVDFWHYRDKDKVEVDIVITQGSRIWGVEVKSAKNIHSSDGHGLQRLADQAGSSAFQSGVVLYDGESISPIQEKPKIYAVPFSELWS